jgi:hypothetical protein
MLSVVGQRLVLFSPSASAVNTVVAMARLESTTVACEVRVRVSATRVCAWTRRGGLCGCATERGCCVYTRAHGHEYHPLTAAAAALGFRACAEWAHPRVVGVHAVHDGHGTGASAASASANGGHERRLLGLLRRLELLALPAIPHRGRECAVLWACATHCPGTRLGYKGSIFWPFNTILVDMSAARISSRSSACVSGRTSTARARTVHVTAAASTQGSGKASSNVVVLGASGYTGSEIVRLLHLHPHLKITGMTAEANAGRPFEEVYPQHVGLDLPLLVKTAVRPLHLPSCIVGANAWAAHYIPVSPHCACIVQPPIAIPLDALDIQDGGSLVTRFMARGQRQSVDRSDGRGATHAPRRLDHAWQGKGRPLPSSN